MQSRSYTTKIILLYKTAVHNSEKRSTGVKQQLPPNSRWLKYKYILKIIINNNNWNVPIALPQAQHNQRLMTKRDEGLRKRNTLPNCQDKFKHFYRKDKEAVYLMEVNYLDVLGSVRWGIKPRGEELSLHDDYVMLSYVMLEWGG